MLTCDKCDQPARVCVGFWWEQGYDEAWVIVHACACHLRALWRQNPDSIDVHGYDRISEHHVCERMKAIRESDGWVIGEYDEPSGHLYLYRWEPFYEHGRFAGFREPHHGRERRFPTPLPGIFAANRKPRPTHRD